MVKIDIYRMEKRDKKDNGEKYPKKRMLVIGGKGSNKTRQCFFDPILFCGENKELSIEEKEKLLREFLMPEYGQETFGMLYARDRLKNMDILDEFPEWKERATKILQEYADEEKFKQIKEQYKKDKFNILMNITRDKSITNEDIEKAMEYMMSKIPCRKFEQSCGTHIGCSTCPYNHFKTTVFIAFKNLYKHDDLK